MKWNVNPSRLAVLLLALCPSAASWATGDGIEANRLTFEERVACELSIQAVYARHRDQQSVAVDDQARREAQARRTVERRLRMDRALREVWNMRLTPQVLSAELERIGRDTRRPDMLAELIEALDHDPVLLGECLARPLITDRRFHPLYQYDAEIHATTRRAAETGRAALMRGERAVATSTRPFFDAADRSEAETWLAAQNWFSEVTKTQRGVHEVISPVIETERGFQVITVALEDGAVAEASIHGWSKAPYQDWLSNRSMPGEEELAVAAHTHHEGLQSWANSTQTCSIGEWVGSTREEDPMMVKLPGTVTLWTGNEMLIWGGTQRWNAEITPGRISGALYNPTTDSWRPMTEVAQPSLEQTSAVWTGSEMIIWGGCKFVPGQLFLNCQQRSGYAYSPDTDQWRPISQQGAPIPTVNAASVWTGQEMIVYTGCGTTGGEAAAYDPRQDSWRTLPPSPLKQSPDGAVWTGSEILVFTGWSSAALNLSGTCSGSGSPTSRVQAYNPATNQWRIANNDSAPQPLLSRKGVWTGQEVIVWGGQDLLGQTPISGGIYNPTTDSWREMPVAGALTGRYKHAMVWTGSEAVIHGGQAQGVGYLATGARFIPTPTGGSWIPLPPNNALPQGMSMQPCGLGTNC